ncbi:MAG: DNA recombination protein RmuC [Planctomycetes bacterium]|nr:DNA recombination protein RmuC [Planctomycetota bacterium]
MSEILLFLLVAFNIALVILVVILLTRHSSNTATQERTERVVKEEICQNRKEISESLQSGLDRFMNLLNTQLESVQRGLGEMQSLASGVGDLKKVLTNVKTRGTLGEIQLGALLEQILTPEQYAKNVATKKGSNDRVEFAIKMPGRDSKDVVWLPIDAKFPMEDYQKLVDAQEKANMPLVEEIGKLLEIRIKAEAKDIRNKYLDPPHTVDFGILFLPIEGLYAEVLRRPGLSETLQREYHVLVVGPTTLGALLNSLQMGFRTLAIEKRSSEVWAILGTIKTEFAKFGEILDRAQKKVQEAGNIIDDAARKSRTIDKKLRNVQTLPAPEEIISLTEEPEEAEDSQQRLIP